MSTRDLHQVPWWGGLLGNQTVHKLSPNSWRSPRWLRSPPSASSPRRQVRCTPAESTSPRGTPPADHVLMVWVQTMLWVYFTCKEKDFSFIDMHFNSMEEHMVPPSQCHQTLGSAAPHNLFCSTRAPTCHHDSACNVTAGGQTKLNRTLPHLYGQSSSEMLKEQWVVTNLGY